MRSKSEVELADSVRLDNERLQQVFDQLSTTSMPKAIQEHIDRLVADLAEPMPEDIAKDARAKDEDPELGPGTPEVVDAAEILSSIGAESKGTLYSTNRMQERWAKDFLDDAYLKRANELVAALEAGEIVPVGKNMAGGQSYKVCPVTTKFRCLCCRPLGQI